MSDVEMEMKTNKIKYSIPDEFNYLIDSYSTIIHTNIIPHSGNLWAQALTKRPSKTPPTLVMDENPMNNTPKYSKVNVVQLFNMLKVCSELKIPVLIRGRHGAGKTSIVGQVAEQLGLKMVARRVSQMSEGDQSGAPTIVNGVTRFNPPDWFHECCDHPRLLFLDELVRARLEVRQDFFELADSRRIFGRELHPDTVIVAADNSGNTDGVNYFVNEMDPAELDRWLVIDFEPSVNDWLHWAKENNINEKIVNFIENYPNYLEHNNEHLPDKVYPSRRSWERLSVILNKYPQLLQSGESELLSKYACGIVGNDVSYYFIEFLETWHTKLQPDDIMLKNFWEKTDKFSYSEHSELLDSILESNRLKSDDLVNFHYQNLWNYVKTLEGELFMKFHSVVSKSFPKVWNVLLDVTNREILTKYDKYFGDSQKKVSDYSLNTFQDVL